MSLARICLERCMRAAERRSLAGALVALSQELSRTGALKVRFSRPDNGDMAVIDWRYGKLTQLPELSHVAATVDAVVFNLIALQADPFQCSAIPLVCLPSPLTNPVAVQSAALAHATLLSPASALACGLA